MVKILKKVTLNAPASTSTTSTSSGQTPSTSSGQTGVDPTKGTETNPYTYREYEDLFRANQWRGGYVEGHGYKGMYDIPDIVIYGDYYIGSGDNPFDDDDWDDDGINPHPNPSPDETGGNGGNYPPGGGGGGGGNGTGGGNGNNGGGNTSDSLPVPKHTPIEKLGAAFAGVSYHDTNEGIYKYYVESRGWSNTSLDILLGLLLHGSYSGLKFSIWEKKENDRIVAYVCSYAGTDTNLMEDRKSVV